MGRSLFAKRGEPLYGTDLGGSSRYFFNKRSRVRVSAAGKIAQS